MPDQLPKRHGGYSGPAGFKAGHMVLYAGMCQLNLEL